MKKRNIVPYILFLSMVIIVGLLSGCGNKESQEELINYINVEIKELAK